MMRKNLAAALAALILAVALLAAAAPAAAMNPSTTTGEWFGLAPTEGAPKGLFAAPPGEAVNSEPGNGRALGVPVSSRARALVRPVLLAAADAANAGLTPLVAASAAPAPSTATPSPSDTINQKAPAIVPVSYTGSTTTHIVRKDESIWSLCAAQSGGCQNWAEFVSQVVGLNKQLTTPHRIEIGQKLVLPVTTPSATKSAADAAGIKALVERRATAVKGRDAAKAATEAAGKELEAAGGKVQEVVKTLLATPQAPAGATPPTTPSLADALVAVKKAADELKEKRAALQAAEKELTEADAAIKAAKDEVNAAVKAAEETKAKAIKAEAAALQAAEKAAEQVGVAVKAALAPPVTPPATTPTPSLSTEAEGLLKAEAALIEARKGLADAEKALKEVSDLQKGITTNTTTNTTTSFDPNNDPYTV